MKIIVGQGSCGIAAGANKAYEAIKKALDQRGLEIEIALTGCIGMCYLEPIIDVINDQGEKITYVKVTPEMAEEIVEASIVKGEKIQEYMISEIDRRGLEKQQRVALRNCGLINPESIDEYIARGGYKAIEKCIKTKTPAEVIEEIKVSGLRGRGGAGFPTWFKWNAALQSPGERKYIICNADEGDPGAFMDRSVLEGDPHTLIEGMLIGGYAIGAKEGIVYVRAEYPLAIQRLKKAIEDAKERGFLGKNLLVQINLILL